MFGKICIVFFLKNGPTLAPFCLFSFVSNTNSPEKTEGFSGIPNRIVGVEGTHADHLTTTTVIIVVKGTKIEHLVTLSSCDEDDDDALLSKTNKIRITIFGIVAALKSKRCKMFKTIWVDCFNDLPFELASDVEITRYFPE